MFAQGSIVLCLSLSLGQAAPADDLKKVQGSWRLVGGEEAGDPISAEEVKKENEIFTFEGDALTITRNGRTKRELIVTVKPGKAFGEIDLKHKGGQYDGKVCHAIYAFEGDVLKICTASKLRADEPGDRPNVFSTKKSDEASQRAGKLLFILKREKQ